MSVRVAITGRDRLPLRRRLMPLLAVGAARMLVILWRGNEVGFELFVGHTIDYLLNPENQAAGIGCPT